ncbi:hypothetical protein [Streptosporangium sp. V21-05]|uniref:hypothetical protein n=1 Tax=Streptosporangium sp. V21-05 TaxID=3446115 RepID=UPI003F52CFB9
MGKSVRVMLLTAVAALGMLFSAAPASAADVTVVVYVNGAKAGSGTSYSNSTMVRACDVRADNLGIRTEYITAKGLRDSVGDANGSADGCGSERPADGGSIDQLRVCAGSGTANCSPWQRGY